MARLPNFLVIIRSEKLSGKGQGRGVGVRKKERFVLGKRTFRSQKSKHFVLRIIRFYDTCKKNKILLEEVLEQDCELAAFNNTAVNTIRVVTLICADDSVRIMAAVLRLSRKGKFADNFHHDGIASLIDVETGIVNTTGVDRKWNRYTIHPDSRKPIVGFQIPRWFEVVDMVKKAARVHPEVRYVGWDVTIKSSGEIVLIEGNPGADPDVTQIEDQVGKWPLYEPLLFEIESCKE